MNKIHPYLRSTAVTTAPASEIPAISSRQDVSPNASIMADGFKTLKEGQKVTFEIEEDPHNNGKSRAANVCVVE